MNDGKSLPFARTQAETIWLHAEHLPSEERLARLLGDERLLADLTAARFEGPEWDFVEEQLLRYGLTVISSWIRSGLIVAKCAEKRVRARAPRLEAREPETADEIAMDIVIVAIVKFRDDVLLRGRYDPQKGASLSTFYIGQCLFQYDNQMAKWENHETSTLRISDYDVEMSMFDVDRTVGTEDDAIRTVMVQMILRGASNDMAARVLAMSAMDYSMDDIARSVGKSLNAVKGILKREKQLIRSNRREGEVG